jgi:hypothetical protein
MADHRRLQRVGRAVLWVLLFLMCAGLGYPTLRRYDPRDARTNFDGTTALYHWQVTGDPSERQYEPSLVHFRYRLLVPLVARPFYLVARGATGTWDAGYFGLLMANSIFVASTAFLVFLVSSSAREDNTVGIIAALLYLLSFAVPNYLLAGLVDSGEAFALMALVWCLDDDRLVWLVPLGIVGAIAKETFVPISVAFSSGWILAERRGGRADRSSPSFGWVVLLGLTGLATVTILFSIANGRIVWPWDLTRSGSIYGVTIWQRARRLTQDVGLVYVFGWLAPLGAFGLARCPRPWVAGALAAAATVVALGIFNAEPGLARSLFNVLGPLLALGSAIVISNLLSNSVYLDPGRRHRS